MIDRWASEPLRQEGGAPGLEVCENVPNADRARLGRTVDDVENRQQRGDEHSGVTIDEVAAGPLRPELLLVGAQALEVVRAVAEVVDIAHDLLFASRIDCPPGVRQRRHSEVVVLVPGVARPLDEGNEDSVHRASGGVRTNAHEVDRRDVRAGRHDRCKTLDPLLVAHDGDGGSPKIGRIEAPQ